jgi:hypothetical protein
MTVKDGGALPSTAPSLLALQGREIAMPSTFSSDDFYSEFGFAAAEVELPTTPPTTLGALPTAVLARIIDLAAGSDVLFTLAEVSHGFQDAVHEHVDMVYAGEERANKGNTDWPPDDVSSASSDETDPDQVISSRPRRLMPAAMALGAITFACIAMWISAGRLILAKLGEALSGATVVLPAGLVTVLIVLLLSTRAGAVRLPNACAGVELPYDRGAIAQPGWIFDTIEKCGPPLLRAGTVPQPSTSGYDHFGHRIDSDICTKMPRSWPHGFTAMMNFCDRYSAEFFLSFL